jgi:ZIP family zinc transporter
MSPELWLALILAGVAGASMPLGAALAWFEHLRQSVLRDDILHGVTAFGGGALISAVALVLVPEAAERVSPWLTIALFMAGGVAFFAVDRRIEAKGGGGAQLLAMLLDYLPEAMALGALLATNSATAKLLAAMIFLQNLPEGFSAFRELRATNGYAPGQIVLIFAGLAFLGPVCAAFGVLYLEAMPALLGMIMIFAAGGILYLVFQDIAPQARVENSWVPPLGAVAGFGLGLAGHVLIT